MRKFSKNNLQFSIVFFLCVRKPSKPERGKFFTTQNFLDFLEKTVSLSFFRRSLSENEFSSDTIFHSLSSLSHIMFHARLNCSDNTKKPHIFTFYTEKLHRRSLLTFFSPISMRRWRFLKFSLGEAAKLHWTE